MLKVNMTKKTLVCLSTIAAVVVALSLIFYLIVLPYAVSNTKVLGLLEKCVKDSLHAELKIVNPVLKTSLAPRITFKLDELYIIKNNKDILNVKNFDADISLVRLFQKRIVINKLGADYIFANVNEIMSLCPQSQDKEQKPVLWRPDLFNSLLYVKKCIICYAVSNKK